MRATGIVRRIDDLGRVVIPKEIRKTMGIRPGAQLEIFTDSDGGVIFKKYSPLEEYARAAESFCETLSRLTGRTAAICDRERVVAASGKLGRELAARELSEEVRTSLERRSRAEAGTPLLSAPTGERVACCAPVAACSEVIGCVALLSAGDADARKESEDEKIVEAAAALLGLQFEE